jgi:hypothetical protein
MGDPAHFDRIRTRPLKKNRIQIRPKAIKNPKYLEKKTVQKAVVFLIVMTKSFDFFSFLSEKPKH